MFYGLKQRIRGAIKRKLLDSAWKIIHRYGAASYYFTNIGLDVVERSQKSALISYITDSLRLDVTGDVSHTNSVEQAVILKTLCDMGYRADVVRFDDEYNLDVIKNKRYDLIFGFGAPFALACEKNPCARKIIYFTGASCDFAYNGERDRFEYYTARHGAPKGAGRCSPNIAAFDREVALADVGLFYRNASAAAHYRERYPKLPLELFAPTGLINRNYVFMSTPTPKNGFLWFGSSGAILKGLDILLDVFRAMPDAVLYVCGLWSGDRWLLDDYRECPNIIDCGFINVASDQFLELLKKACWVVMPSASEGMATSVLTCMRHGRIPVVTDATGVDTGDFGFRLEDYSVEHVRMVLDAARRCPDDEIIERMKRTYETANELYSIERFARDFRSIMERVE